MTESVLASWRNGKARDAILDFVNRATHQGGPDFVAPADRIAACIQLYKALGGGWSRL